MIQNEPPPLPQTVPWTKRDVWLGAGFLGVWIVLDIAFQYWAEQSGWKIDLNFYSIINEIVFIFPAWFFGIRKYKTHWSALGFRGFAPKFLALALGLLVVESAFNIIYSLAVLIPLNLTSQNDLKLWLSQNYNSVWVWIGVVIAAPICEELFFRGFLFGGLKNSHGWKVSAVISAGLFSLLHFDLAAIPPIFVLGFLFAYLYHRSQSLWPSILMHMFINLSSLILLGLTDLFSRLAI
jgi:hypothetical protein